MTFEHEIGAIVILDGDESEFLRVVTGRGEIEGEAIYVHRRLNSAVLYAPSAETWSYGDRVYPVSKIKARPLKIAVRVGSLQKRQEP